MKRKKSTGIIDRRLGSKTGADLTWLHCLCDRLWNTWMDDFNQATLWFALNSKKLNQIAKHKFVNPKWKNRCDRFAFPLNLASLCLISLFAFSSALRMANSFFNTLVCCSVFWQNMHRDWTDKWFCATAIFIYSLFSLFRFSECKLNFAKFSISFLAILFLK